MISMRTYVPVEKLEAIKLLCRRKNVNLSIGGGILKNGYKSIQLYGDGKSVTDIFNQSEKWNESKYHATWTYKLLKFFKLQA